jgi:hypothetical protein
MIVSMPRSESGTFIPLIKFISVFVHVFCINDCPLHHFPCPGMACRAPWSPPRVLVKPLFKLKRGQHYQLGHLAQWLVEVLIGACIGGGPGIKPVGLLPLAYLF